ncbi:hypothetical protein Aab01nite_31050 [Paractinoplanes abujensis]|uniref:Uncharacterized protein (DUF1684 family) n=1 Tax=Paractinoplanes abujensis TaxID=882441 RepID=A0A7W7D391_9ACTN|nr:DUF1684 domain-containing protein [Actinoplanes abujensis]MBB4698001.1 uncharacterized protein (DUF1684 family) [Actinoplanes abujensis]GID19515.1 hypothetical protein Aab01nite_31050 [Actinoplanes abujensis]
MDEQLWAEWHAEHERTLADPHGFLAVTSLNFLTATPQRFPDAPGEWSTGPAGPVVTLAPGESLTVDGTEVTGRHEFGVLPERGGRNATAGDAVIEVAKRGGFDIVRPRHPGNALRTRFRGTPTYEPTDKWQLTGRYVPFDTPQDVTVGAAVEGLEHIYESPGVVEFEALGTPLSLTVFNGRTPGSFFALFTDETSGITTYAANRSLAIAEPASDGTVTLDFNRATNLPCAYTDFATCPLPPAENKLPVPVEAGEKIPYERQLNAGS